MGFPVMEMRKF